MKVTDLRYLRQILGILQTKMSNTTSYNLSFTVIFPKREDWDHRQAELTSNGCPTVRKLMEGVGTIKPGNVSDDSVKY